MRATTTGAVAEAEVICHASDGALDQDLEELMPEGPQRTRLDWKNLGKYGPDVDDPRTARLPDDRATLRRSGRVSIRRGYRHPPLPVDTVARIVELRDEGLSFKKIGKALRIAAWTVSRYVRSFEKADRGRGKFSTPDAADKAHSNPSSRRAQRRHRRAAHCASHRQPADPASRRDLLRGRRDHAAAP